VSRPWCIRQRLAMTGQRRTTATIPLSRRNDRVVRLKAIIPVAPNTSSLSLYRIQRSRTPPLPDYIREDIDVLLRFSVHSGPEDNSVDTATAKIRKRNGEIGFDRKNGDYNDFWAGVIILNQLDRSQAAVF